MLLERIPAFRGSHIGDDPYLPRKGPLSPVAMPLLYLAERGLLVGREQAASSSGSDRLDARMHPQLGEDRRDVML
jgi:hypothetical protein